MKSICVFCGSSSGTKPEFLQYGRELGAYLAKNNFKLVYGGAQVGVMGAVADACLAGEGEVVGVIPDFLGKKEVVHPGLSELHICKSMHERKKLLYEKSDAFVILPGGFGTMDEFFESLTWLQLGLHQKPIGVLNIDNFYSPLVDMIETMHSNGFIKEQHKNFVLVNHNIEPLLNDLKNCKIPTQYQWLNSLKKT